MSDNTTTWREVAAETEARLSGVTASPANETRWIVERAAGFDGSEYVLGLDEKVTERGMHFHDLMVERRLEGEPLQYVLGRWGFRTLDLFVDRRVLIPRPETEVVAGLAIAELQSMRANGIDRPVVVDLGTGSGAIGLSVAAEVERAEVWISDASTDALVVARSNLAGIGRAATRVRAVEGSWFEALPEELTGTIDLIVSNPPYVAIGDEVEDVVREWEPMSALFAGDDGLDDIRKIVTGAVTWLRPGGTLVLEMAPDQVPMVSDLALANGFVTVECHSDLAGRPRAVVARVGG
ncbi:MAG: peptide chain release factor N(5)-glutamine methyltransferase [Acidimicrobiia bacterium]|nr:peptide chain release factor N(5)-glutamine methyltransferase [Acidimicrobiia bacterium]